MNMVTLAIVACANMNSGLWCGKQAHNMSYAPDAYRTPILEDKEYVEVEQPTIEYITEALYGRGDKPATISTLRRVNGCSITLGQVEFISPDSCKKILARIRR
jgi:hypothetical protein